MFDPFFDALAAVLNFFYTLIPNYGFSIMALTVLVMVLITPLTVKSTKSMLQMQRMQPEMKRIQAKYKNDREKLNEELMKFYRENQINPLGGCLPMIAQMPVFIIMYRLLRGLTTRQGGLGSGIGHILGQSGAGKALTPWIFTDQPFRPDHLSHSSEMYQALSHTNTMNFLGLDLSLSPAEVLRTGFVSVLPYMVLLGIMLATGIYQNRQLQARNTSGNVNPQQQMIMKVMPFFLPVFSFGFPAGLALYWCTQNVCRIGTNAYITHSVYKKEHAKGPIEAKATEKPEKSNTPVSKNGSSKSSGVAKKPIEKQTNGNGSTSKSAGSSNGAKRFGGLLPKAADSKPAGSNAKASDAGPGKSVKSQKARENAAGGRRSATPANSSKPSKSSKSTNQRRSGEPRRTDKPQKG